VDAVGHPPPIWEDWGYSEEHLPPAFHQKSRVGSLLHPIKWVNKSPLTPLRGHPPSYKHIEGTVLALGMALCELRKVVFDPEDELGNLPGHLHNSPFNLHDWDSLANTCRLLVQTLGIQGDPPANR
jgi:hypothetical protein